MIPREEAESELSDIANNLNYVLTQKIEPEWLFQRYESDLRAALETIEMATTAMSYDQE